MDVSNLGDITALANLIKSSQENEENELIQRNKLQPPTASGSTIVKSYDNKEKKVVKYKDPKDIWDVDELPTQDSIAHIVDERPCPRYEISYKQVVGSEDVFLGMSDKTPSSADCSHLVVKIHFPNSTMKELDLDVTANRIKAESKTHRLFTYLPQTVDSNNGKAKFDAMKEVLTVVLPIVKTF